MSEETHEGQVTEQTQQEQEILTQSLPNVMAYSIPDFIHNLFSVSLSLNNIPILTHFLEFSAHYLFVNITSFTQEQVMQVWNYFFAITECVTDPKLIEYVCQTLRVLLMHSDVRNEQFLSFLADLEAPNDKIKPYLLYFLQEFWPNNFILDNAGHFINLIMSEIPQCDPKWIPFFLDIILDAKPTAEILENYSQSWEYLINLICNLSLNHEDNHRMLNRIVRSLCAIRNKYKDLFTQKNQITEYCLHQIMNNEDSNQRYSLLIKFLNLTPVFSERNLNLVVKLLVRMTDSHIIENQAVPPGITKCDDIVFNEYSCWLPLISRLRYKMERRHKLGATLLLSKLISKIFDDNKKKEDIKRQENSDKVIDTVLNLLNEKDVPLQPILEAGCGAAKYCSNNDILLTAYFPILQANYKREDVQKTILENVFAILYKCDECCDQLCSFIFGALEGIMPENLKCFFNCVNQMILTSYNTDNMKVFDDIMNFMIHVMKTAQYPANALAVESLNVILYKERKTIQVLIENECLDFVILLLQSDNAGEFSCAPNFVLNIMRALDDIEPFREKLLIAYTEIVKIAIGSRQIEVKNIRAFLHNAIHIMARFNKDKDNKLPDEYLIPIESIQILIMSENIDNKSTAIYAMPAMFDRFDFNYTIFVFESCVQWMKVTPDFRLVDALDHLAVNILKRCTEVPLVLLEYYISTMISRFAYYQSNTFEEFELLDRDRFFRGITEIVKHGLTWFIPAIVACLQYVNPSKYYGACNTIEYFVFNCNPDRACIVTIFNAVGEAFSKNYHHQDSCHIATLLSSMYLTFCIADGFQNIVEYLFKMYKSCPKTRYTFFTCIVELLSMVRIPIEDTEIDVELLQDLFIEMSNFRKHYKFISYKSIIPSVIQLLRTNTDELEIVKEIGIFLSSIFLLSEKETAIMIQPEPIPGLAKAIQYICKRFEDEARAAWNYFHDEEHEKLSPIFNEFLPYS